MSDQSKQAESKDPRVQAALREYLERVDRGEAVNREEFISRHAEIADALRSFFGGRRTTPKDGGDQSLQRKRRNLHAVDRRPGSRDGPARIAARWLLRHNRKRSLGAIRPLSDHPRSRQGGDGGRLPGRGHAARA